MGAGGVFTRMAGRVGRVIVACVVVGSMTAACGGDAKTPTPSQRATSTPNAAGCLVGASWWNWSDSPISLEEPALQKVIADAGGTYSSRNTKSAAGGQAADIDALRAAGAKVIVIEPGADSDIVPAVQRATDAGIAVLTLNRPIEHTKALYVDFDLAEVGRQQATALLAVKPKGKYAIIKGQPGEYAIADLVAAGAREALQPAIGRGDVTIVAEVDTALWSPTEAQQKMTTILGQNAGSVDAVVTEQQGLAWGVREALKSAGLEEKVAVGSVSIRGDDFTALRRGQLSVQVWGNPELLGTAVGRAAVALCHDPDVTKVDGSARLNWPGHDGISAVLLKPVAITKDNLDVVVKASAYWRRQVCDGLDPNLDPSGPPSACT